MFSIKSVVIAVMLGVLIGCFLDMNIREEKRAHVCLLEGKIAEKVMVSRQSGVERTKLLEMNKAIERSEKIIKEAYGFPIKEKDKEKTINSFKKMIEDRCLEKKKHH